MVMGVSGCGKSTVGACLAEVLGGVFLDGDDYHPAENVAQMASGQPLTDAMRWPWLAALARAVNEQRTVTSTVFACSALKQSYRVFLRDHISDLRIAYLDAPRDVVRARVTARENHYMPAALLDSQLATLEPPRAADAQVPITLSVEEIVDRLRLLG